MLTVECIYLTILFNNLIRKYIHKKGIHVRRYKTNQENCGGSFGIEEEKVTEEASFIDDLGADSLDTVELVMAFEEEFDQKYLIVKLRKF